MLLHIKFEMTVVFNVKSLEKVRIVPKSLIAARLLHHLSYIRAEEKHGYILAVTKVVKMGRGRKEPSSQYIHFPVTFWCRTFLPKDGDIMIGTVYFVTTSGVFLKCGPMSHLYLSARKMPNYSYVDGEKPHFLSNDHSRIEKDIVVRLKVFAVRWVRSDSCKQFHILATIDESSLGPIQTAGCDGMDLENPCPD
ncbi:OLC1v1019842C1 [Oldenlandia corymbosa var. corymbosa]|nr:OLC1v1019842C1 [Oldenlandia corymbosa var. corymbosa]